MKTTLARYTLFGLCFCYFLFIFRVLAQLIQKYLFLPFLPPFETWYSGVLSYPWLLASQIFICALMGSVIVKFYQQDIPSRPRLGQWLLIFGGIYFLTMSFRLVAGFTFAEDLPWLGARIPAFFHVVLASFLLLLGHYYCKVGK